MSWAAIDRQLTHWRILIGGWALFVAYSFPGYMSYDSTQQLAQARGLIPTSNWHPPAMAYLWRLCDALIAGPFLMLAIQSLCLLAGAYLLLRRALSARAAAIAASVILLSPPVLPPMAVIWKDSQMAGFLLLAIAVMTTPRRCAQIAACVLVFLATAQRYNAAAATLPVLLCLFVWKPELARWKRRAIAAVVWLALTFAAMLTNKLLADTQEHVFASLALVDIAGMVRYHHHYSDDEIRADAPDLPWVPADQLQLHVNHLYNPTITFLELTNDGIFRYPTTDGEGAVVAEGWRRMIVRHPVAYLRHRLSSFLAQLRVTHAEHFYIYWGFADTPESEQWLGEHLTHSWLQDKWFYGYWALRNTPFYWVWLYFLVGIALVWLCRRDAVSLALAASGVLCEASLFIVAPATDYRYSHWMVTTTIIAAVCHVAHRRRSRLMASGKRDEAGVGLAGEEPVLGGTPGLVP